LKRKAKFGLSDSTSGTSASPGLSLFTTRKKSLPQETSTGVSTGAASEEGAKVMTNLNGRQLFLLIPYVLCQNDVAAGSEGVSIDAGKDDSTDV